MKNRIQNLLVCQTKSPKHLDCYLHRFGNRQVLVAAISWTALCLCFIGCQSYPQHVSRYRVDYFEGDIDSASAELDRILSKKTKDETVFQLDQSLINLSQGKPTHTEQILCNVRDQFKTEAQILDIADLSNWVRDDRVRTYHPDDYELLFIQIFLLLANLLRDGDDAYAYANQVQLTQNEIETKLKYLMSEYPENQLTRNERFASAANKKSPDLLDREFATKASSLKPFQKVALAPYVVGVLFEQTHRDYDTAARFYEKAFKLNPEFKEAKLAMDRCLESVHSSTGNGVLHVFAAVGKGPSKIESLEIPTSQAMLIADRILSEIGDHSLPPTVSPIKTARIVTPHNSISGIQITIGDQSHTTQTITNLSKIAIEQQKAKLPGDIARAVVRRAIKKSAIYASKDALSTGNHSLADGLLNLGGILWEATESADTRCWQVLPERIEVARIELPAGRYPVTFQAISSQPGQQSVNQAAVEIRDGANTYVFVNFPTTRLAGKILVSGQNND